MKLEGCTVYILKKLDPSLYEEHETFGNGKHVVCSIAKRSIQNPSSIPAVLERPRKDPKNDGFEINPYDWCAANKMVDGQQLTIV